MFYRGCIGTTSKLPKQISVTKCSIFLVDNLSPSAAKAIIIRYCKILEGFFPVNKTFALHTR